MHFRKKYALNMLIIVQSDSLIQFYSAQPVIWSRSIYFHHSFSVQNFQIKVLLPQLENYYYSNNKILLPFWFHRKFYQIYHVIRNFCRKVAEMWDGRIVQMLLLIKILILLSDYNFLL